MTVLFEIDSMNTVDYSCNNIAEIQEKKLPNFSLKSNPCLDVLNKCLFIATIAIAITLYVLLWLVNVTSNLTSIKRSCNWGNRSENVRAS